MESLSEFLRTESMCIIAQQSDWSVVRNYKLIPVKCVWKTFCVGELSTEISRRENTEYLYFCSLMGDRPPHKQRDPGRRRNLFSLLFCCYLVILGQEMLSALCQNSRVYKIKFTSCPCGILGWGNTKHHLIPWPLHLPSSTQFTGGMNWLRPLWSRGFPLFNFQENQPFVNSMTLKTVCTDRGKYLTPLPTNHTIVLLRAQAESYGIICIGLCADADFRGNTCNVWDSPWVWSLAWSVPLFAVSQSQEGRGKGNLSFITKAQLGAVP